MRNFLRKGVPAVLAGLILGGCAAVHPIPQERPQERDWVPADYAAQFGDADPWEGFNRSMFAVNNFGMFYLVRPVGWLWGSIFPRPVIKCLDNASENLTFPAKCFAALSQAKWQSGGVEFLRFLTNTTIGIAGLFDPADAWFDLWPREETFGQAFETWGIGSGYTLVLPLSSSTNVRDTVGSVFDTALDVKTYLPYGVSTFAGVNRAVNSFRPYSRLIRANADPYEVYKEFSLVGRQLKQRDWALEMRRKGAKMKELAKQGKLPKPQDPPVERPAGINGRVVLLRDYRPENPYADTTRVAMFVPQGDESSIWTQLSPWNTDFTERAEWRSIPPLRAGADDMEYYFWRSPDQAKKNRAPLVFLLPGIGAHHSSPSAVAMAEVLYSQGYAVVILPSVFSYNYFQSRLMTPLPGYTPRDAQSLRHTMKRVLNGLEGEKPSKRFVPESISVVGMSLGGLDALHIAAQEEKHDTLNIRKFVAINPPVDLLYALERVDECGRAVRGKPAAEVEKIFSDAFGKGMALGARNAPFRDPLPVRPTYDVPEAPLNNQFDYRTGLSETEAKLLVALSFRFSLRDTMMVAYRDERLAPNMPRMVYGWSDRTRFYLDVDRISFRKYVGSYMVPMVNQLTPQRVTLEEISEQSGLRAVEPTLRGNDKVHVLHTLDDFLVSDADRTYLDGVLGDKVTWFSRGGHLGNLYYGQLQQILVNQLR